MATKVILTETIDTLGIIGAEATVADGYARNYLLPRGKAVLATPQNKKILEQQKARFELQIAKEREQAEELAKKVQEISCTLTAKVSQEDRLYGSITAQDILEALKGQEVTIEKRMLLLAAPIKELGTYKVPVRLYKDVEPEITVEVKAEAKEGEE
ncbi:50S ribosomal protein L9 [Desulfoluna limicola]|uniref:Large ribosomal subunit protein bL9 n=1 Tax=Desulfoluna limicola TaxID=2810562 RepID=A0ABM7PB18_9BACT|nr:50S ribosomal protein L9 [Desulfoluna limicola]BCS94377.1 50S ribosomal protein L9 [Desulfoluna limicola]